MAQSIQEKREARRRRREEEAASPENESKGITEGKGRATPSRRKGEVQSTDAPPSRNPVVRAFTSTRDYFLGVQSEMEKVTWPNREETGRLTRIVMAVLVASAIFLGGLSILFTEIFNLGVEQPWVFILVFVVFVTLLLVYGRFSERNNTPEY